MAWTSPRTWTAGELISKAIMDTHVRDNLNALLAGLLGTGYTLLDLLGAAAPAVSSAGHAVIIYNTATNVIEASVDTGAYAQLGTPVYQNPLIISRWREIVRA